MLEGYKIDDSIKMNVDAGIDKKPLKPLSKYEKKILSEKYFKTFLNEFRYRMSVSKCLESSEIHDLKNNPTLLQGRAYIYMRRCLSRFDKSRYSDDCIGVVSNPPEINDSDLSFAVRFNIIKKKNNQFIFNKIVIPVNGTRLTVEDIDKKLKIKLKKAVAIGRLRFYWIVFYRQSINYLAGETIKVTKFKNSKEEHRESGNLSQVLSTIENNEDSLISLADFDSLKAKIRECEDPLFSKFLFCSRVLQMEINELLLEFGEDFNHLKSIEKNVINQYFDQKREL